MDYITLYNKMVVNLPAQVEASIIAESIRAEPRYKTVQNSTGVSSDLIGVLHYMESGGDFSTHLYNGDSLKYRTVNFPEGRPLEGKPPFSWESSATDAIIYDNVTKSLVKAEQCQSAIRYNGTGYEKRGIVSPYGFGGTNFYKRGKYVEDGVYSSTAVSDQVGACVILKELERLEAYKQSKELPLQLPVQKYNFPIGVEGYPADVNKSKTSPLPLPLVILPIQVPANPTLKPTVVFRQPDPSDYLSKYFTVGEFNKNGSRQFTSQRHLDACKRLALALDDVRNRYRRPVYIRSGIRTPANNEAAGGASGSYHLTTNQKCAADIVVKGISNRKVFADYNGTWMGGLGLYSTENGTTHFDLGEIYTFDKDNKVNIKRSERRWDWSDRASKGAEDHNHDDGGGVVFPDEKTARNSSYSNAQ